MADKENLNWAEPLVGIFRNALQGLQGPQDSQNMRSTTQQIEAANFAIAQDVHTLSYRLLEHRNQCNCGEETETEFNQASASIHADINDLLGQFRSNRETDLTDYQLLEACLLFAFGDADWHERWIVEEFNAITEHIRVDDGGKGSCLQNFCQLFIKERIT